MQPLGRLGLNVGENGNPTDVHTNSQNAASPIESKTATEPSTSEHVDADASIKARIPKLEV